MTDRKHGTKKQKKKKKKNCRLSLIRESNPKLRVAINAVPSQLCVKFAINMKECLSLKKEQHSRPGKISETQERKRDTT